MVSTKDLIVKDYARSVNLLKTWKVEMLKQFEEVNQKLELTARIEKFDTFWEGPDDVEKGYGSFGQFYRMNYLKYLPVDKASEVLVVCCGPGYFVNLLREQGYTSVLGIDSDPEKVKFALERNLNCRIEKAFQYLQNSKEQFDVIICEQELNHLTKDEIILFLVLCRDKLRENGKLIVHSLNGANPITGAEALAQNFDHYNTFTEYSLKQVLSYCGFTDVKVFPLNLYVFYNNPFNYIAMLAANLLSIIFRGCFVLYGKHNKLFAKKIAAIGKKE
jgi:2-polyprenyl-3-methyl-5-hydroxy-6-metoxy-1,4-benzoquinol methylase